MTTDHATIAQVALAQYGLADAHRELSQDRWNITYCVTTDAGQKYNLRICGAALQDRQIIADELTFVDFVAQRNEVQVPQPIRNTAGEFVTFVAEPEPRVCCLFTWIEGEVVRTSLTDSVMHEMGRATALLHQAARNFRFPTPEDPFRKGYHWDETLVAEHREWMADREATIAPDRVKLIHQAIDHVLDEFGKLDKHHDNYGFIHADLTPNNFIVTNSGCAKEEVSVIDFEQLGRGHFCYDFAVIKTELAALNERVAPRWTSFKAGYQTVAELPFADERELDPFVMAVHLGFLDWIYNTPSRHVKEEFAASFETTHNLIRRGLDAALLGNTL